MQQPNSGAVPGAPVILDCDRLREILPDRYPLLMVDRVLLDPAQKKVVGIKNVSINEPFFQGHFPGTPVMPGVLMLEAMVQTGGVALRQFGGVSLEGVFLKTIRRAKFRKPVIPGDRLLIEAEILQFRPGVARLSATAKVRDQLACQADFTLGVRSNLDEILRPSEFVPDALLSDDTPVNPVLQKDITGVMQTIPHRYPFILVDAIISCKDNQIVGLKNVTGNEPFFSGHFPSRAVMPGTLLVEAMAQVGAVYILNQPNNRGKLGYFMGVNMARFRRPVRPGDQLVIAAHLTGNQRRVGKAHGYIRVGQEIVAQAEVVYVVVDKNEAP